MLKKNKIYLILSLSFSLYLLILPQLATEVTPCLKPFSRGPFEYAGCNFTLAINRFIYLGFAGLLVALAGSVFLTKKFDLRKTIALGVALAALLIAAFYIYLPTAQKNLEGKEIYLDTFYEEYGSM